MTAMPRFDPRALGLELRVRRSGHAFELPSLAPSLIGRERDPAALLVSRRTKIWELSRHLHCSIVGTCLTTGELRQVLGKTGTACDGVSDHDLHGRAVLLAGQHDGSGKLLHKMLDKRHRAAINQFGKAKTVDEVRALWREAVARGEIPGAYWAALTHPEATESLVRDLFGEVHMLSHLVGAANRADIRRLCALEAENLGLREKLRRQQERLREDITSRDAAIRDLIALLARRIGEDGAARRPDDGAERAALAALVGDLERRLGAEADRRAAVERRLERMAEELRLERERRGAAEHREALLRDELATVEASLAPARAAEPSAATAPGALAGLSLLYVGGRPSQLSRLRSFGAARGATILHHDGGLEDRGGLLAGLVSRADLVMFPVDCVSHDAALMVKRLCRQAAKPYIPLRSTGLSSFAAALCRAETAGQRPEASPAASA
jgi:hypothetical protein